MPKARRVPQRTCVGCGEVEGKRELVRIVRDADGRVAMDVTGKRNGRGAYVHRDPACFQKAMRGRLLRALRAEGATDQLAALTESFGALLAAPPLHRPTLHRAAAPLPEHLIARDRRGPTRTPSRRRPAPLGGAAVRPGGPRASTDPASEEGDRNGDG